MDKIALAAFNEANPDLLQKEIDIEITKLNGAILKIPTSKEFADSFLALASQSSSGFESKSLGRCPSTCVEATFFVNRAIETSNTGTTRLVLIFSPLLSLGVLYFTFLWILKTSPVLSVYTWEFSPYMWYGSIGGLMSSFFVVKDSSADSLLTLSQRIGL